MSNYRLPQLQIPKGVKYNLSKNEDELQAISRVIKRSKNEFVLLFVGCNLRNLSVELNTKLQIILGQEIQDIFIDNENLDIFSILNKYTDSSKPLSIIGFEELLPSDNPVPTLGQLNHNRGWFKKLNCTVIFWLPEYAIRLIAEHAPDFWAWRSGTYVFHGSSNDILEEYGSIFEQENLRSYIERKPDSPSIKQLRIMRGVIEELLENVESKTEKAKLFNNLGEIADDLKNWTEALTYYKKALELYMESDAPTYCSDIIEKIIRIQIYNEDLSNALAFANNFVVQEYKLMTFRSIVASLNNLSQVFQNRGDYEIALSYLKQSLVIGRQIGSKADESATLNQLSQIHQAQGDYETALTYLKQSLAIRQQIDDKIGEGAIFNNISRIYQAQGDYETALTYLKQSLAISQQIGDKAGEGTALHQLSQIFQARGDYETALTYLKQSLAISQQIGDKMGEGVTFNNISRIYQAQGDYETALSFLKQSLAIRQKIGDKAGEGATLNNLSQVFQAQGDYRAARSYLEQSLAIRQQIGDKAGEGATLNNLSQIYQAQGDYETALTYLKQSLAISQQIGDKAGEGTALHQLSQIFQARGDYETAFTYLKQSLAIRQQIGDKAGEGVTLGSIGNSYYERGDYETALAYLKQSLDIRQQIGDREGLFATLFNMGHIYARQNQSDEAARAWVIAYVIAKQSNLTQALKELADLAPRVGLPEGLEGWEKLAQAMQGENSERSEEEQINQFVQAVVRVVREKSDEAPRIFEAVSKMAVDPNAPPHYQELGNVLKKYMSGIRNPDLSNLPKEIAEIVRKAFEAG